MSTKRGGQYTGTEWLKSLAGWRLVIRRGPTFWSCRIPGFQPDDHPRAIVLLVRAVPGTRPLSFPVFHPNDDRTVKLIIDAFAANVPERLRAFQDTGILFLLV